MAMAGKTLVSLVISFVSKKRGRKEKSSSETRIRF